MLRISDRYISRQVLMGTLYAVIVLCLVLVLGNLFKKIQPLLVEQKAPLGLLLRFVVSVIPVSLMYTLPWGFLSAVLLVFGRMSSHNEITSFRVAGVSLPRLALPVFVIGACLCLVSLWLNINVVPSANATSKQLLYEQATRDPDSLLKPGVAQGDFRGGGGNAQQLLIEDRDGEWVTGFHFYILPNRPDDDRIYVHASRASLATNLEKRQLSIKLDEAYIESSKPDGPPDMIFANHLEPLLIDLKNPRESSKKVSGMTNEEIRAMLEQSDGSKPRDVIKLKATIMKRYSFSMACLAFAFIAVPLGLTARRTETSRGLVVSLAIGIAYFLTTVIAEQLKNLELALFMLWAPNVLCVLLGLYLMRRARYK
ncbi:MAG TPA: LptF/LptG family permease [Luteolibacter sp.]|nr:LptF/LptG family permease [Luteolibacter sp.]